MPRLLGPAAFGALLVLATTLVLLELADLGGHGVRALDVGDCSESSTELRRIGRIVGSASAVETIGPCGISLRRAQTLRLAASGARGPMYGGY